MSPSPRVCPHCGQEVPQGARHCPFDGKLLSAEAQPEAAEPTGAGEQASGDAPRDIADITGVTLDDRYVLEERIGTGGLGQVYRGRHLRIHRHFAIKVMHAELAMQQEFLKRFDREARALSRLSHPCCVAVTDYGKTPHGVPYLVMELLKGEPLSARIERDAIALGETLRLMELLLGALDHAHQQGIIHRDIKPANIMLVPGPADRSALQPKLLDFGLAKLRSAGGDGTQLTAAGFVMGTPPYIAPELISAGGSSAQKSCDLYALGVILYELVCGQRPFESDHLLTLLQKHLNEPPRPPRELRSELPRDLEQLMLRALAKRPAERFPSAEAFREALRQLRDLPPSLAASRPPSVDASNGADLAAHGVGRPRVGQQRSSAPGRSLFRPPAVWIVIGGATLLLVALVTALLWLL